jgi:Zn-dependent protease
MSWSRSYAYGWPDEQTLEHQPSTSSTEILQILVAYLVLTFDMVVLFGGVNLADGFDTSFLKQYLVPLVSVSAAAALTGFVAHEMAHKVAAQRRGFWAEFRASPVGLIVSVITALLGFLWAAPGATVVNGVPERDREDWGHIALAGPMTNVAFAAVFYVGSVGAWLFSSSDAYYWLLMLAFVNGWFGVFNMIPIGPLDGRKVFSWSAAIWILVFVAVAAFAAALAIAFYYYGDPLFV